MDQSAAEPQAASTVVRQEIEENEKRFELAHEDSSNYSAEVEKSEKQPLDTVVAAASGKSPANHDPYAHLPADEKQVLLNQTDTPPVRINALALYRYASKSDLAIMFVSVICAIAGGAAQPLMTVIFGGLAGTFQGYFQGTVQGDAFSSQLSHFTLYFVYLAVGEFVTIYIATVGFLYTGEHLAAKIRENYLAAILRQNVGYYDNIGAGEITTRITSDTNLIQDGISEKVALAVTALATFISAFVIGFIKDWLLTLIMCSSILAIVATVSSGSKKIISWNKDSLAAYADGGTVAEEVLASIRNATAFGTQNKLALQYDSHLARAQYFGVRYKGLNGLFFGVIMCIIYLTYGLAFWEGSRLLVRGENGITLSDILTILLAVMIGSFSLGNVAPHVQAFTTATAAAGKIFNVIDRASPLDPSATTGEKPRIEGRIELRGIKHIYPSRPEVTVMDDVSLVIPANKTTALVGSSGSGKSTIVGLIERFYDPVQGRVFIDGSDVRDINLRYLREQISLVGQEPVLFGTTIFGNIAHGLIGTQHERLSKEEQMARVIDAAKMANAHSFISELPEGYETNVGERGFLLSGGQKQRIAIARAVISNPKILLLDEATSALDTKSEGIVQAALDNAAQGRTTITIAHRLSTIKGADQIVVMAHGKVVETGTHDSLLAEEGAYYGLVEAQKIAAQNEEDEDSESEEQIEEQLASPDDEKKNELDRVNTNVSTSAKVLSTFKSEERPQYSLWKLFKVIASFNREEKWLMFTGLAASVITGGSQSVQSLFFAKCIVALSRVPSQYDILRHDINFWSLMFLMLAFVVLIAHSIQGITFAYCSEWLVRRARDRAFRVMLRQDVGWYDKDENSSGALTSYLSTEATHIAGLSGSTLGTILQVSATLVCAFILSLAIGWKLALVCIATVPVVLACGYYRFHILAKFQQQSKAAYEKSASYACEATSAIRTVASLTRESDVWENYHQQLAHQRSKSLVSALKNSLLYAMSQSFMLLAMALGFWYGGTLIGSGEYDLQQFFICFASVIFGAQSAGTIFSFAPDMGKAKHAAAQLQALFDRRPKIDTWSEDGAKVIECSGALEFKDVHFRYPTRPQQPVLRGLDLKIRPGQYVALVGASGCGKSTTIGLLERFYDPLAGQLFLDGVDIKTLNVNSYRNNISLVSQEPTLYQGTIKENILLGAVDDGEEITDDRLERACRDANIWDFIQSLPEGFGTKVGNKGVMLSGGQKQRIAIARALIRNPKVLLLDEATSALDSESEKVVQAALDKAARGRTTVAIAHRLSTIQNADCIFVFEGGKVIESGTHSELLTKAGRYFELVNLQSLGKTT